jgi:hypothetical protein
MQPRVQAKGGREEVKRSNNHDNNNNKANATMSAESAASAEFWDVARACTEGINCDALFILIVEWGGGA